MTSKTRLLISLSGVVALAGGAFFFAYQQREKTKASQTAERHSHLAKHARGKDDEKNASGNKHLRIDSVGHTEKMSPELARKRLAECYQIPDVELRSKACFEIMEALCRAGYANEAFALITPEAGEARSSQIEAIFGSSNWTTAEAVEKIKILADDGYRGDGVSALRTHGRSLNLQDFKELVESPDFNQCVSHLKQQSGIKIDIADSAIASYFAVKIFGNPNEKECATYMESAIEFHNKGKLSDSGLARTVAANASLSVFEKWNTFSTTISVDSGDDLIKKTRDNIVLGMVNRDAETAMAEIAQVGTPQGAAALSTAAQQWLMNDGGGKVAEWYQKNKDHLPPSHRDAITERFLLDALSFSERDTAQEWANQILDPKLKEKCLGRIAEWESRQAQ